MGTAYVGTSGFAYLEKNNVGLCINDGDKG